MDPAVPTGLNGWYTGPVTVTLSTYGGSEYKLNDEASWHAFTMPIVLNPDGAYTVSYRSKNSAGIAGADQTAAVNIDKIAPVTTASVSPAAANGSNGWYTSDVTVTLDVYDNVSGVAKTEYQVNDNAWMTFHRLNSSLWRWDL